MSKSRTLAVMAAALSLTAVAACGSGDDKDSGDAGDAKISYLTFETPALTADFWNKAIAEGEKAVPGLTVEQLTSPTADRNAYAKQLNASGQLPDVMAGVTVADFLQGGLLTPFDEKWLEETLLEPEIAEIDGKTYSPPNGAQSLLVYYNKSIFEEAGIESAPATWDEFKDAVSKLKAAGVTPIEMAGGEPWSAAYPLIALFTADVLGADDEWIVKRKAGEVKFTDDDVVAAVDKQVELIEMGAYDKNALAVKYADANTQFLDGKAGMYIMGNWLNGVIKSDVSDNFGAFPLPTDNGDVVVSLTAGGPIVVSSKTKYPEQSMAFAEAFSASPENLKALVEQDGLFPLLKDVTLESMGANVTDLYKETYKYVTEDYERVSWFCGTNNEDACPAGIADALAVMSQKLFTDQDVEAQLEAIDVAWDKAS